VQQVFVGKHLRQLDAKGRLALPAEYLARLAPEERSEIYLAPGRGGCLHVLPRLYWEGQMETLAARYPSDVEHEFYHHCQLRSIDKAGRVLLDEEAREMAQLPAPEADGKTAVVVCGSGRYLQVWGHDAYRGRATSGRTFAGALPSVRATGTTGAAEPPAQAGRAG
jgi:MraZ protein